METLDLLAKSVDRIEGYTKETRDTVNDLKSEVAVLATNVCNEREDNIAKFKALEEKCDKIESTLYDDPKSRRKGLVSDYQNLVFKCKLALIIAALTVMSLLPLAAKSDYAVLAKIYKVMLTSL